MGKLHDGEGTSPAQNNAFIKGNQMKKMRQRIWNSVRTTPLVKRLGLKSFRLRYVKATLQGVPRHAMKAYGEGTA